MPRLALYLLGPPRIELDGEPIHIGRRKALALLAYLAVTGRPHSRDSLAALLWPEYDQSSARADLRRTLSLLNRTLGDEWLTADRETAGLNPDVDPSTSDVSSASGQALWLDVEAFRQKLAACETHGHPPTEACAECVPLLENAAALYRDHFLAGFTLRDSAAFDEWQFFETEGLKDELAGVLVRLASYHTSQGDFEAAIVHARRWLALDPLNEAAHRHLMVLYAQAGQRAAALRQCESCRQLLADELGVEPSERTQETHERLLKGELPIGPTAVEAILERELRTVGACPYRGLSPFREPDAPFFFGREAFTERLEEAVRTRPLVAVIVGSSGSGKSSAVFAGLLPRLREQGNWLIASLRPGAQPFHAKAATLLPVLEPGLNETDRLIEARRLAQALSEGDVPLYDVVGRALKKNSGADRLLLLVDQFEELYTLCPQPGVRRRFLDELLAAVEAASGQRVPPFVLLLTMRADFMEQALAHRPFADALQEASLMLGPMTREELRAAIEKPAERQGAALEAGLVERLLDDVGEEPGNLPLLEFALTLLWERLDFGWMTHAAYGEIGRAEGALARYAEEVYGGLGEGEQEQARRIFVQLVQPGEGTADTRRMATRGELGDGNWPLVQHLADKRLVVTGRDATTGGETVEVVHEALIQRWGQLRAWMEEGRAFRTWQERLRAALSQWEATGQDEGVLLRGAPLAEAEGWLDAREAELSTSERAFIQASVELREQQAAERERQIAERDWRRRRTILALAGGLVITGVLTVVALLLGRQANLNANAAQQERQAALAEADLRATAEAVAVEERQAALAEADLRATAEAVALERREHALVQASIGLASQAQLALEGTSPERSVLLALEALEHYPYTWQAERALSQAVLGSRLRLILQHEAKIDTARWSPDGTRILTASDDGTAKVWDADIGEEVLTLSGHEGAVRSAVWSPSGEQILTASEDGTARVWSAVTGEELELMTLSPRDQWMIATWSPTGELIVTASQHGEASVWDATTGKRLSALSGKMNLCYPLERAEPVWSPDGSRIAAALTTYSVLVWDAASGERLLILGGRDAPMGQVAWSPDGSRIVSTSFDAMAKVWDAATGEELFTLIGHMDRVHDVAWSPDGSRIVTGGEDDTARVWDAATGEELFTLGHDFFELTAWSPDGSRIATTGGDWVKVWDASTGTEILTLWARAVDVAWSPSSDCLLITSPDGTVRVWDLAPTLLTVTGPGGWASEVTWSPTGDRIARGFKGGTARVWDAVTGEQLDVFSGHSDTVSWVGWSPDGARIATASFDGTATVRDAISGNMLFALVGHYEGVFTARWSPDGARIATASFDGTARVWDADTGTQLLTLRGHTGLISSVEWSPDGTCIATAGFDDGSTKVWDAATGQMIRDLYPEDFKSSVRSVAWSPDGTCIATCGLDGGRIWDATTGEELASFGVDAFISWSRTGDRILGPSIDGMIRVWDADTGAELVRHDFEGPVMASWSPDGKRIAAATMDGALKVLPAWQTTQELIDYAKECCVVRELTDAEREQFGLPPR